MQKKRTSGRPTLTLQQETLKKLSDAELTTVGGGKNCKQSAQECTMPIQ
jgi:hypothetical protein